jgi:hypothetical protein
MKNVDMLAFGAALALGLAVAQTRREIAIALGVASASLLAKLLMTVPSAKAK